MSIVTGIVEREGVVVYDANMAKCGFLSHGESVAVFTGSGWEQGIAVQRNVGWWSIQVGRDQHLDYVDFPANPGGLILRR